MTIESVTLSETPESDRMQAAEPMARAVNRFLDWASESGYVFGQFQESNDVAFGGRAAWFAEIDGARRQKLLAQCYNIDLDKVAAERRHSHRTLSGKKTA